MSEVLRTVVVDGFSVQTTDQGAQAISKLQGVIDAAAVKLTDAATAHAAALSDKDKALAIKDAEIDSLKAKILSDADLDKRVAARADLISKATTLDASFKCEGLSDADIRKGVVKKVLGDAAVADKSDAYLDARFDILVEDAGKTKTLVVDQFRKVAADPAKIKDAESAHTAMVDDMTSAWQKGVN